MSDTFARRYAGAGPWEEIWFLEAIAGPGRAVWIRWVIADGTHAEGSVWALAFVDGEIVAHRDPFPLAELTPGPGFGRRGGAILERGRAVGGVGSVRWDLQLVDRGRRHTMIPSTLERLRIGRHYAPAIADLEVRGTVEVRGQTWALDGTRGVLGHIHGGRNRTRAWTWAHCNRFEGADALFEGLSARLGGESWTTPPLTTLALHLDGATWTFGRTRELLATRSRFGSGRWIFEARRGPVRLVGEAQLPVRPARVRYTDPDGRPSWCENSPLSSLRLHLTDTARGIDRVLVSREAAFETGGRDPLPHALDVG